MIYTLQISAEKKQKLDLIKQELFSQSSLITILSKPLLSKNKKKRSILRSPHVNKNAQEHFHEQQYKNVFLISLPGVKKTADKLRVYSQIKAILTREGHCSYNGKITQQCFFKSSF